MSRRRAIVVGALWRMTPPAALIPPAALAITAWSIALHLFGSAGLRGDIPRRILITLLATALMFAVLAIGAVVVRRIRHRGLSIAVSFTTFIVSAVVRAFAIQSMLIHLQMRPADMRITVERLLGATIVMTMALMAASYVASLYLDSRDRHAVLSREMTRLSAALERSGDSIREQQAQAVERVRDLLTKQVSGLPLDSADDAVRSLSSLVGDVVRPMSHELARSVPT